jgi:cyclopropane-fatty-acyl-phospholipid synthase
MLRRSFRGDDIAMLDEALQPAAGWLFRRLARRVRIGRVTVLGPGNRRASFGAPPADNPALAVTVRLRDWRTAVRIALWPDFHVGESYMDGSLTIEQGRLEDLLEIGLRNFPPPGRGLLAGLWRRLLHRIQQANATARARRNVVAHYDLSEILYASFLDADRQYSCAYFPDPAMSLEEAQEAKKRHIAAKLLLRPGQRVLDIGCGWGGLALTLARLGKGQVTGITLSDEQLAVARRRAEEAGLDHRVGFALQDYRQLDGRFDRIVSVGMFEHVGTPNYQAFFDRIAGLLTEDGVALIHSIGRMDGPGVTGAWIRKYIFPGGYVPALSEVLPAIERAGLWVTDLEVLRLHYAETLLHWRQRFTANIDTIRARYDERFCRMWLFYLTASEMSFRYGGLMVFQVQLAKAVDAVPLTRDYIAAREAESVAAPAEREGVFA